MARLENNTKKKWKSVTFFRDVKTMSQNPDDVITLQPLDHQNSTLTYDTDFYMLRPKIAECVLNHKINPPHWVIANS